MDALIPTRSTEQQPQLGAFYDTRGQVVAAFLSGIHQEMFGNPGPLGNDALWWLRWLQRSKSTPQYRDAKQKLQGVDEGYFYFDADPVVQYGLLLALEENVAGLIRGLTEYPDLHVPVEVTHFKTGANLTEEQWLTAGRDYVEWAAKNLARGLLSVNYLDAILQGIDAVDIADRKWAIFSPPPGLNAEESDSFRVFLNEIGYNTLLDRWRSMSMEGWRRATEALENRIEWLGIAHRAASYASGYAAVQKVEQMLDQFFANSQEAHSSIAAVEQLYADGKLEGADPHLLAEFAEARHQLGQNEQEAYNTLSGYELWEGDRPRVYPAGLGLPVTQVVLVSVALVIMAILSVWLHREVTYRNRIFKVEKELSQYALGVLQRKEYLITQEHKTELQAIQKREAAGEITAVEASRLQLEANRRHQSSLSSLQTEIASVPTPSAHGAGIGSGAALLGIAAIGGITLWKLKG